MNASAATPDVFRADVELMRPKALFVALAATLGVLAIPIVALAFAFQIYGLMTGLLHCALFGSMALRYGLTSTRNARFTRGTLAIRGDEKTLRLNGEIIATRAELRQGFVVPTRDGIFVRLERKARLGPPIFIRVKDEPGGIALIRSLGFDAEHVAAEIKGATGLLAMGAAKQTLLLTIPTVVVVPPAILIAASMQERGLPAIVGLVGLAMVWALGLALAPTAVRIGTDGILTRWLGRTRFYPFSTIETVEVYDEVRSSKRQHGVRLTLRGGEKVRLPTGQTDIGAADATRMAHRIVEARAARDAGAVAPHAADVLLRGHRSLVEWVRDLRRIGAGARDPRSPAVPVDVLLRVVEDSAAPAAERASAALAAVSADQPDDARRRVRVAAETTASPKLRIALAKIAEVSAQEADENLASTLEELARHEAVR